MKYLFLTMLFSLLNFAYGLAQKSNNREYLNTIIESGEMIDILSPIDKNRKETVNENGESTFIYEKKSEQGNYLLKDTIYIIEDKNFFKGVDTILNNGNVYKIVKRRIGELPLKNEFLISETVFKGNRMFVLKHKYSGIFTVYTFYKTKGYKLLEKKTLVK